MPTFQIGKRAIDYELRRVEGIVERRIMISPESIEVVALSSDDDDAIAGFLDRKRQWLFNTVRDMEHITAERHVVPRFITGSRIPYRGRKMKLTVRRTDAERTIVTCRKGFIVDLPHWVGDDADELVASELRHWLKQRVRKDVREIAATYRRKHGLIPRSIRIADLKDAWGSCGAEGNILINWTLVFAPWQVLEYVVAHELVHIRHRSHGEAFWNSLRSLAPAMDVPREWLVQHAAELSSEFLRPPRDVQA